MLRQFQVHGIFHIYAHVNTNDDNNTHCCVLKGGFVLDVFMNPVAVSLNNMTKTTSMPMLNLSHDH